MHRTVPTGLGGIVTIGLVAVLLQSLGCTNQPRPEAQQDLSPSPSASTHAAEIVQPWPTAASGHRLQLALNSEPCNFLLLRGERDRCSLGFWHVNHPEKHLNVWLYHVQLTNLTSESVPYSRSAFLAVSSRGVTYQPLGSVPRLLDTGQTFPGSGTLPPKASVLGYVFFDGRPNYRPSRFSYIDGDEVLTIILGRYG